MGKITTLILIVLYSGANYAQTKQNKQSCLQLDIVLVGDLSGSVSGHEGEISQAFIAFIDRFTLSDMGVRVGIVTFSDAAVIISPLSTNKPLLKQKILEFPYASGTTNLLGALEASFNVLQDTDGILVRDVPKLIIIVTDGVPDDPARAAALSEQMQRILNIGICGILVQHSSSSGNYLDSITSPFCRSISTQNYGMLIDTMKQMDICL